MQKETLNKRDMLFTRFLFSLISLVLVGMGILIIFTERYYGYSSKFGGSEVLVEGSGAVVMGAGVIVFGLFPMSIWAKTGKRAALWASFCMVLGLVMLFLPTILK